MGAQPLFLQIDGRLVFLDIILISIQFRKVKIILETYLGISTYIIDAQENCPGIIPEKENLLRFFIRC